MTTPDLYWKDYRHIAAWNRFMGDDDNTEQDQRDAASIQAPIDTLYLNMGGDAYRMSDLTEAGVKRIIENFLFEPKVEK